MAQIYRERQVSGEISDGIRAWPRSVGNGKAAEVVDPDNAFRALQATSTSLDWDLRALREVFAPSDGDLRALPAASIAPDCDLRALPEV